MRKILLVTSICLGLSLICGSSYADVSAQDGYILNVNGGYSWLLAPRAPTNYGTNSTVGTYKVNGGTMGASLGYQWAIDTFSTIGIEAGYSNDGKANYTGSGQANDTGSLALSDSSIDMLATFNTMWNNGMNVFIKGGLAMQTQKATLTGPLTINSVVRTTESSTERAWSPVIDFGLGYMITNNLDVYTSINTVLGTSKNNWAFSNSGNDYNNPFGSYSFRVGLSYIF
jgi:hypothetical protein